MFYCQNTVTCLDSSLAKFRHHRLSETFKMNTTHPRQTNMKPTRPTQLCHLQCFKKPGCSYVHGFNSASGCRNLTRLKAASEHQERGRAMRGVCMKWAKHHGVMLCLQDTQPSWRPRSTASLTEHTSAHTPWCGALCPRSLKHSQGRGRQLLHRWYNSVANCSWRIKTLC